MITNQETGFKIGYYTNKYLEAKTLRGNHPNLHFQYLTLRKIGKVQEFLLFFPMYEPHFNKFLEHFTAFKDRIHQLYWDVHVKKTITLENRRDRYFVEKIHYEVFIPQHKLNKTFFIDKKIVEQFLDSETIMIPLN